MCILGDTKIQAPEAADWGLWAVLHQSCKPPRQFGTAWLAAAECTTFVVDVAPILVVAKIEFVPFVVR